MTKKVKRSIMELNYINISINNWFMKIVMLLR